MIFDGLHEENVYQKGKHVSTRYGINREEAAEAKQIIHEKFPELIYFLNKTPRNLIGFSSSQRSNYSEKYISLYVMSPMSKEIHQAYKVVDVIERMVPFFGLKIMIDTEEVLLKTGYYDVMNKCSHPEIDAKPTYYGDLYSVDKGRFPTREMYFSPRTKIKSVIIENFIIEHGLPSPRGDDILFNSEFDSFSEYSIEYDRETLEPLNAKGYIHWKNPQEKQLRLTQNEQDKKGLS